MRKAVADLKEKCGKYPNFVLSSGCDIPWNASWENIKAFFE
jgi:uroporphyrinogen decarboxylase